MAINRFNSISSAPGYSSAYGGVPQLPTSAGLASNLQGIINQAIPGFNGLTQSATNVIGSALGGQVPTDVRNIIADKAAAQAVSGGMPGSSSVTGTLFGNSGLRSLGLTSLGQQQQGVHDLLGMLQGYSGTVAPTFGQSQEQENARAQYAAAPNPTAAAAEQERLYNKYSNPALGFGGGAGGAGSIPWWQQGKNAMYNAGATTIPYKAGY